MKNNWKVYDDFLVNSETNEKFKVIKLDKDAQRIPSFKQDEVGRIVLSDDFPHNALRAEVAYFNMILGLEHNIDNSGLEYPIREDQTVVIWDALEGEAKKQYEDIRKREPYRFHDDQYDIDIRITIGEPIAVPENTVLHPDLLEIVKKGNVVDYNKTTGDILLVQFEDFSIKCFKLWYKSRKKQDRLYQEKVITILESLSNVRHITLYNSDRSGFYFIIIHSDNCIEIVPIDEEGEPMNDPLLVSLVEKKYAKNIHYNEHFNSSSRFHYGLLVDIDDSVYKLSRKGITKQKIGIFKSVFHPSHTRRYILLTNDCLLFFSKNRLTKVPSTFYYFDGTMNTLLFSEKTGLLSDTIGNDRTHVNHKPIKDILAVRDPDGFSLILTILYSDGEIRVYSAASTLSYLHTSEYKFDQIKLVDKKVVGVLSEKQPVSQKTIIDKALVEEAVNRAEETMNEVIEWENWYKDGRYCTANSKLTLAYEDFLLLIKDESFADLLKQYKLEGIWKQSVGFSNGFYLYRPSE